jgi:hypothetical protein
MLELVRTRAARTGWGRASNDAQAAGRSLHHRRAVRTFDQPGDEDRLGRHRHPAEREGPCDQALETAKKLAAEKLLQVRKTRRRK